MLDGISGNDVLELDYEVSYYQTYSWSDRCKKTIEQRIDERRIEAATIADMLGVFRSTVRDSGKYRSFFFSGWFRFFF